jgi:hypothetical protein
MAQGLLDCPVKPGNDSEGLKSNRKRKRAQEPRSFTDPARDVTSPAHKHGKTATK